MKHGRGDGQAPWEGQQYPPEGYGQQYPQDQPWQRQQDNPSARQQMPFQQQYPQRAQPWEQPQYGQHG